MNAILDDILSMASLIGVARYNQTMALSPAAGLRIQTSRATLEEVIGWDRPIYGVTTGVGDLSRTRVSREDAAKLSRNIVLSHACGVGEPLPAEQVRAIMAAAVANWARGYSGVRLELVQMVLNLLNRGVTPCVPGQGGMGSLMHMAHVGLVILGLGKAWVGGQQMSGGEALLRTGLFPLPLAEKEGLSLVNGTPAKTGLGALAAWDAMRVLRWADLAGAMSLEALGGQLNAFDDRIHRARRHPGQAHVAARIRRMIEGSLVIQQSAGKRLQDALSLRCIPQVHGACGQVLEQSFYTLGNELNSATDNPLVFEDGSVVSGCNAHGEPVALALEQLVLAVTELAAMSERRVARLVNPQLSGLPAFLVAQGGLNSGFMIPQYTAASLVAECRVLCHPVTADNAITAADQEDHWSMGTLAARKALQVVANAQYVFAIELLTAAQALEFRRPAHFGRGTEVVYGRIRQKVPAWLEDREFHPDIEAIVAEVRAGPWLDDIEAEVGLVKG